MNRDIVSCSNITNRGVSFLFENGPKVTCDLFPHRRWVNFFVSVLCYGQGHHFGNFYV